MEIQSLMPNFEKVYSDWRKKRRDEEKLLNERLIGYRQNVKDFMAQVEKLEANIKEDRAAYLSKIADLDGRTSTVAAEQSKIKKKFSAGELTADEYMKIQKPVGEIAREERFGLMEELRPVRTAINEKSKIVLDLYGKIFAANQKMKIILGEFIKKNIDFLDREKSELQKHVQIVATNTPTGNLNDHAIIEAARKGAYWQPIIFDRIESWEQLEKLALNGAIAPDLFDTFDRMVCDLKDKGVDFKTDYIRITYHSTPFQGLRDRGFDWNIIRRP
jgi:predicted  nucleic acid-binding Zn-ribbon protein